MSGVVSIERLNELDYRTRRLIDTDGDCWLWTGYRDALGYGRSGGTTAHRNIWIKLVGPVDRQTDLDHLCRNPPCVNPAHMEPVTHAENIRRGSGAARTHCPQGHEYTPENTYNQPSSGRACRRCMYLRNAVARARRIAERKARG